jgi:hypothetical protein
MTELAGRGGIGGTSTFNRGETHAHNKKKTLFIFSNKFFLRVATHGYCAMLDKISTLTY